MKAISIVAVAVNAALYVALGIILTSIAPIYFGGVKFWPQVIIPATFAVVFGPWVGGVGAAIGIFISDVSLGGDAFLSLLAGVTSNFLGFWLIGYIANKKIDKKKSSIIYGALTAVLAIIAFIYTEFPVLSVGVIIACYLIYLAIIWRKSKWVSYELGSVVGLLVGASIIGVVVPVYAYLFAPGVTAYPALTDAGILATFTWTFATEIPFLLVLGPPIIAAIYRAFPSLQRSQKKGVQIV